MSSGYIKIHRKILNWGWRSSPKHYTVFCYCLERAHFKDQEYMGSLILRGSFPTSYAEIAEKTGLTMRQVRRVISDLKGSGELVTKSSRKGTVITVKNWDEYQNDGGQMVTKVDSKVVTKAVAQRATNKKEKKEKKEKNKILTLEILELWNSKKIINHNPTESNLEKISKQLSRKLKSYSASEISEAIENYARTVSSTETYFNFKWPLWTFLQRQNASKFYPGEFVYENYLANKQAKPADSLDEIDLSEIAS